MFQPEEKLNLGLAMPRTILYGVLYIYNGAFFANMALKNIIDEEVFLSL